MWWKQNKKGRVQGESSCTEVSKVAETYCIVHCCFTGIIFFPWCFLICKVFMFSWSQNELVYFSWGHK